MEKDKIYQKFKEYPSYLKKGDHFLAEQFRTTAEVIKQIREQLKNNQNLYDDNGLTPDKWEIRQIWKSTKGDSIQFRPKTNAINYEESFRSFVDNFTFKSYKTPENKAISKSRDLYMVLCLFDVHLGRIASEKYVGEGLSLESQNSENTTIIDNLLFGMSFQRVKEIIIPIGNDFFNVDNVFLQTTAGTPQDNSFDLHQIFKDGLDFLSNLSITLSSYAPVKLVLIPGNHDRLASTFLAIALEKLFANDPNIEVDSSPKERKYLKLGSTLIGLAHGNLKAERYANLLPYEAKEFFSECSFFEYLLGDIHHEKYFQQEINQTVVRYLSGITKKDNWTYQKGFLSTRRAYSICYHETQGRCLEKIHQIA